VDVDGVIEVVERGERIAFSLDDLMRYHGPGSPGGVALGFKALERGLPLLGGGEPCERREVTVATAFGGPGARDAFELVLRAVTGDRFDLDPALRRPELGAQRERFVFRLGYRGRTATLVLRDAIVTGEFARLAFARERTAAEEQRLEVLKRELAERAAARSAADVYDVG